MLYHNEINQNILVLHFLPKEPKEAQQQHIISIEELEPVLLNNLQSKQKFNSDYYFLCYIDLKMVLFRIYISMLTISNKINNFAKFYNQLLVGSSLVNQIPASQQHICIDSKSDFEY
jgi:hypothetical protein